MSVARYTKKSVGAECLKESSRLRHGEIYERDMCALYETREFGEFLQIVCA